MTTGKDPDFILVDEHGSLTKADFAELEKRVLAHSPLHAMPYDEEIKTLHGGESREKLSDFIHPQIADAYRAQAMQYLIGMDFGEANRTARAIVEKDKNQNKRAKVKAARKQRRKQK